jgi:NADPH-dependent glutamate synthase beta subunit-like oxidoreductase
VFEAEPRTGGQLRLTEATAAADLASAVDHLTHELAELGVPVHLGVKVDADMLATLAPDHVVLATGTESVPGCGVSRRRPHADRVGRSSAVR